MNTFGLASTAFRSRRFGEAEIENIAVADFRLIDLTIARGHIDLADGLQLDEISRAAGSSVSIGSVSAALDGVLSLIPVARDRGWPLIVARVGPCRLGQAQPSTPVSLAAVLEKIVTALPDRGLSVAIEVPAGKTATPETVVAVLESLGDPRLGVCFDAGHAHLAGGAPEWADAVSGLILTARLHDNSSREDLHRAPGEGSIRWPEVLTACWKTGFAGPWILDVADEAGKADAITRAVGARTRLQAILDDLAQPMTFPE